MGAQHLTQLQHLLHPPHPHTSTLHTGQAPCHGDEVARALGRAWGHLGASSTALPARFLLKHLCRVAGHRGP